ncbi:MAG: hypothetical protein ACOCVF_00240 [bacterium]
MNDRKDEKPKSIIVNGLLHKQLKSRCRSRGLKIGSVVEDLIKIYLKDSESVQRIIDKNRKESA